MAFCVSDMKNEKFWEAIMRKKLETYVKGMRNYKKITMIVGFFSLAACQPQAVAPPVVVSAPPVVRIPPVPVPPLSSAAGLTIPARGIDGTRNSPNKGIGPEETLWHVRSSFNVAALICQGSTYGRLAGDYNNFLKKHKSRLSRANRAIEGKYQRENKGRAGRRARDTHITSLYNYFSLPPVKTQFCSEMLTRANEIAALSSSDLIEYSRNTLPKIDSIFTDFYDSYEEYEKALADWQAQYGN